MKPQTEENNLNATLGNISIDKIRNDNIESRLRLLIAAECKQRNKFAYLEGQTEINSATWRTWWTRGGTPNGSLIEASAKIWPHYAYWLATGKTDVRCGHDMPELHPAAKGYISNWPEEASMRLEINNNFSREYFKSCLEIQNQNNEAKKRIAYSSLKMICKEREKEIESNFVTAVLEFETIPT
jgi:hypothetical protein